MPPSRRVFITRRAEFAASHILANPQFSLEENLRVYGPCAHPHGHGHNYILYVTLAGEVDPATGMLMDLKELKRVMEEKIVSECDHKNLNVDPSFLKGVIPTAENLVIRFWEVLQQALPRGLLYRVRLYESPRNFADYFGEDTPDETPKD